MAVKLKNNVVGFLGTTISASDTGLTLQSGNGAMFPILNTGDYFYATLVSSAGTIEIVKVTARVGDTLTVVRGAEGTSSTGFAAGSRVEMRITAASVADSISAATVSLKSFGAIGDGVADDSAAFVSFLDYLVANGGVGLVPTGTYHINPVVRNFTGSKPFSIVGEGKYNSILKNRSPNSSFLYWTSVNNFVLSDLTLDGDYTAVPVGGGSSGAHLAIVNSSYVTIKNVRMIKFRRCALMAFNDHQTNPANIYTDLIIDGVDCIGNANYVDNVGPSALLVADYNNSRMQNCYIENIGLYGYEYKNDCNHNLITDCIAKNTFNAYYFGGDGIQTNLGYVKNTVISDCIALDCQNAFYCGLASNNTISNLYADFTNILSHGYVIGIRDNSNNNSLTGIKVKNRKNLLVDLRTGAYNNYVEFTQITDGAYTGRGSFPLPTETGGNVIIFGARDSTQALFPTNYTTSNNLIIDVKQNWKFYPSNVSGLVRHNIGDLGVDKLYSTSRGVAWLGDTMDEFYQTKQNSQYRWVGNFSNRPDLIGQRARLDTGDHFLYTRDPSTGALAGFVSSVLGFRPDSDNNRTLGQASFRWSTVFAANGTIQTSDATQKQQVRELTQQEKAVAQRLKGLIRAYKFNDAVAAKGSAARTHIGVIAQEVKAAFEAEGLDGFAYGLLCLDEWDTITEEKDEHGNVVTPARAAGSRYSVRYDELLAFIIGAT